jgi:prevent-host-death family protein
MANGNGTTVNVHEAKTHFSKLLQRVRAGERIIIARAGVPVAVLGPYQEKAGPRRRPIGMDQGKIKIDPSFWEPVPELEELT